VCGYLDEIHGDDYGRLLAEGDEIAFNVGFQEWQQSND